MNSEQGSPGRGPEASGPQSDTPDVRLGAVEFAPDYDSKPDLFPVSDTPDVPWKNAWQHEATVLLRERDEAREQVRALKSLAQWLVTLDEPDATERRTITLTQIIDHARAALAATAEEPS